ncbi:hypothetical protein MIMGU_mgv1a026286mg [Erythranthe guttata]|uniref:Ubiquitin receptor RAD23 n=1 Tax=Erythranthe guttata TaxID=4155 RepID=A0A022Q5H9_ERYGU|nr:hypothetical protein MIMGU_mgv1a026286mg [Erythranthe guttata]
MMILDYGGQQLLIHDGKVLKDESNLAENKVSEDGFLVVMLKPSEPSDSYAQAATNLTGGSNNEQTIQQLIDMGGGSWDNETVTSALPAAYNNAERAVDYSYSLLFVGRDIFDEGDSDEEMPHAVSVTPEEEASIERMEAIGFERALVIEAFLACDCNEELAVNYLLENAADYED